jgi:hypothetical protein
VDAVPYQSQQVLAFLGMSEPLEDMQERQVLAEPVAQLEPLGPSE